jgi:hypothetical protein
MSTSRSKQKARRQRVAKAAAHELNGAARAKAKVRKLWQMDSLFHVFSRYPRRPQARRVDRLAGILKSGLVAPGLCEDGSVFSDLNIIMKGSAIGYDKLVFLHRYDKRSYIYTIFDPSRYVVFVDPDVGVLTQEDMGQNWCILCLDEVYVRDQVPADKIIGIAADPSVVEEVRDQFLEDFQRLAIPLYTYEGDVVWP